MQNKTCKSDVVPRLMRIIHSNTHDCTHVPVQMRYISSSCSCSNKTPKPSENAGFQTDRAEEQRKQTAHRQQHQAQGQARRALSTV